MKAASRGLLDTDYEPIITSSALLFISHSLPGFSQSAARTNRRSKVFTIDFLSILP